jgi:hypothetical protein
MRTGKIDPMVFILLGAVVGCGLMFTCYRAVSSTLGPSLAMTGAASAQFGKTVNVTDKDGVVNVMITDTAAMAEGAAIDSVASARLAHDVAKWILTKRTDTTTLRRMSVNTVRTVKGTVMPKVVHGVTFRSEQLDSLRRAAGVDSMNSAAPGDR